MERYQDYYDYGLDKQQEEQQLYLEQAKKQLFNIIFAASISGYLAQPKTMFSNNEELIKAANEIAKKAAQLLIENGKYKNDAYVKLFCNILYGTLVGVQIGHDFALNIIIERTAYENDDVLTKAISLASLAEQYIEV